jgi:hypothetical protein
MSYDLYLYKKKNATTSEEQVADYFSKKIPFTKMEGKRQWIYENPDTGVYFLMNHYKRERHIDVKSKNPEFENLKFDISINFMRPDFFGLEIFPLVDKLIADLDIYMLNPQDPTDSSNPVKFEPAYLLNQWLDQSHKVTDTSDFDKHDRMPTDKSNYLWQYQFHRKDLENSIVEDIYIPNCFIVKDFQKGQLHTMISWPDHIPIVIFPVDYFIIGRSSERGLVSFDTMMKEFGDLFEPLEYKLGGLRVLRQDKADTMQEKWDKLNLELQVKEFGEGIRWDSFVN